MTGTYIQGGGLVGAYASGASGTATIGALSDNTFAGNNITAGTYIQGGGILAVISGSSSTTPVSLEIGDSWFTGNAIIANNGSIKGGLIHVSGYEAGIAIRNSLFADNQFVAKSLNDAGQWDTGVTPLARVFGAVGVDTSGDGDHVVSLSADNGGGVVCAGNTTREKEGGMLAYTGAYGNAATASGAEKPAVSFYFGPMLAFTTNSPITWTPTNSGGGAELKIDVGPGSAVELLNPRRVEQDSDKHLI